MNAIYISNISPLVDENELMQLFVFAGNVTNLTLRLFVQNAAGYAEAHAVPLCGRRKEAAVEFETNDAINTALLLSNAFLRDAPIIVTLFDPSLHDTSLLKAYKPSHGQVAPSGASAPPLPVRGAATQPVIRADNTTPIWASGVNHPPALPPRNASAPPSGAASSPYGAPSQPMVSHSTPVSPTVHHSAPFAPSATHKPRYIDYRVIFLSNLCPSVTSDALVKFLEFCGPVTNHSIDRDTQTALVEFRLSKSLQLACLCTETRLGQQELGIEIFEASKHGSALFQRMFGKAPEEPIQHPLVAPISSEPLQSQSPAASTYV